MHPFLGRPLLLYTSPHAKTLGVWRGVEEEGSFTDLQIVHPHHVPEEQHRNRNRKLLISRAPTKAKSQEPAYSQALNQNKIDRQRSRSRESGRETVRRLWWMVFGVETGREEWG